MKDSSLNMELTSIIRKEINEETAILQKVILPKTPNIYNIYLKREDLIHPIISGNKWRKLKYNLIEAKQKNKETLLTFGGAFSNHIHATASAGKIFHFKTIGIIRGEKHLPLNPTLSFAVNCGMKIHYLDRKTYRRKNEREIIESLEEKFGNFYLLPEGGTNQLAVKGASEIVENINIDFDYILSACGTGGTLSGIICGLKGEKKIIGIPVLKGANFLANDINNHVKNYSNKYFSNWTLNLNYHFGGYAKISKELVVFIKEFEELNSIKLDPIYTGKLLYAIKDLINNGQLKNNAKIIAVHTGGLQGNEGMKNKIDKLLSYEN